MKTQEIHLELLLGKAVQDHSGKVVGHIQEIRVEQQDEGWIILEYLLGVGAILERLSAWTIGLKILSFFGAQKIDSCYRVPWDKLNLSDPNHPRLNCSLEELDKINQPLERVE